MRASSLPRGIFEFRGWAGRGPGRVLLNARDKTGNDTGGSRVLCERRSVEAINQSKATRA